MTALPNPFRLLPLSALLLLTAAEGRECTIILDPGEKECVNLDEFCPDLQCAEFARDDSGCPICECDDPGEGEGEGEGDGECLSDRDCGPGQICALMEACPACVNAECDAACVVSGICIDQNPDPCAAIGCPFDMCFFDEFGNVGCGTPPDRCSSDFDCFNGDVCVFDVCSDVACADGMDCPPPSCSGTCQDPSGGTCFSDSDCGFDEFCDFSSGGSSDGGGQRPAPPECDPNSTDCFVQQDGVCRPIESRCALIDCGPGFICVDDPSNGAMCIPSDPTCGDTMCPVGQHCETSCQADPNCPFCDICQLVPVCVDDFKTCEDVCGPNVPCVIDSSTGEVFCDGGQPTGECTSDQDCDAGLVCNAGEVCLLPAGCDTNAPDACWAVCAGFCVDPNQPDPTDPVCRVDADCPAGGVCVQGVCAL